MKKLLLACTLFAALAGCKKEIDELPEPTQTGANSFGAKLDGELWVPQKFGIAPTAPLLEARYAGANSVFINARNFSSSPTETEFELYIKNITGTGTYPLNQNTGHYPNESASYGYFIRRKFMPLNEWITSALQTGSITVTRFDPAANIISGTFEFSAVSIDSSAAPITVTEGRFDVKIE